MESDYEAQQDELVALKEILESEKFFGDFQANENILRGHIAIDLSHEFLVDCGEIFSYNFEGQNADNFKLTFNSPDLNDLERLSLNREATSTTLEYLPPLILHYKCPKNYPSTSPPEYTLSCPWAHPKSLTVLCTKLDEIWRENQGLGVLYAWADFLENKSAKLIELNGTQFNGDKGQNHDIDPRVTTENLSMPLLQYLDYYNTQKTRNDLTSNNVTCPVCLVMKKGVNCIKFENCRHSICKDCTVSHFNLQINEGDIEQVKCLEFNCQSRPSQAQLKSLVSPENYAKFEKFLLSRSLSLMADVVYCPRLKCQAAGFVDGSADETLAECLACGFTFCRKCQKVYHGVQPCYYNGLDEKADKAKDPQKEEPESHTSYKSRKLKIWENRSSRNWVQGNSKPCPRCKSPIEKNEGCSHMSCTRCETRFCWLCGHICKYDWKHECTLIYMPEVGVTR